ncbi:TPA: hypothetical protein L5U90_003315 [Pseudomonas aeruginosa]|nr:hypothetical protein [Pseudomonas aeruginosa]
MSLKSTYPGFIGTAHAWTETHGAQVIAVTGELIDTTELDYSENPQCLDIAEQFRSKLKEAFSVIWQESVNVAFDVELEETLGGHMRKAPSSDSRPQDKPGFNRLHHIAQLWVDYLTARHEQTKQKILYEAACNMQLLHRVGAEGETVLDLVENAIRTRGVVYGVTECPREWAVALDGGVSIQIEVIGESLEKRD